MTKIHTKIAVTYVSLIYNVFSCIRIILRNTVFHSFRNTLYVQPRFKAHHWNCRVLMSVLKILYNCEALKFPLLLAHLSRQAHKVSL